MADAAGGSSARGETARTARPRWLGVWARAVIAPAARRATAIWAGCAVGAAIAFGPTAMTPRDLTTLAWREPSVGAALAVGWILVYAPIARMIVRGDAAAYLRSLPGPRWAHVAWAAAALVGLQLPWLALWVVGDGARGGAVVATTTAAAAALARWRPPATRGGWPSWTSGSAALRAVHLRALQRRAGDALVRGVGLAVIAGAGAGLVLRNGRLLDGEAGAVGAAVIAVMLVPAHTGPLLVIGGAHGQLAWLAASMGIPPAVRAGAVVSAIAAVHGAAAIVALAAAAVVARPPVSTLAWLAGAVLVTTAGQALGGARALLAADGSTAAATRVVVGSIAMAAVAVLALGSLGAAGALAVLATGALAVSQVRG